MATYRVTNVYPHDNETFSTAKEARKAMREWGYVPTGECSCDGRTAYWINVDDLPEDDIMQDAASWADWILDYIGDGAYTPSIVTED